VARGRRRGVWGHHGRAAPTQTGLNAHPPASPASLEFLERRRVPRTLHPSRGGCGRWSRHAASRTTNPILLILISPSWLLCQPTRRGAVGGPSSILLSPAVVAVRWSFGSFRGDIDPRDMHVLFSLPHIPCLVGRRATWRTSDARRNTLGPLRRPPPGCCSVVLVPPTRWPIPNAPSDIAERCTNWVRHCLALNIAPQLVESVQRVRRARKLRAARATLPRWQHRHTGARRRARPLLNLARQWTHVAMAARPVHRTGTPDDWCLMISGCAAVRRRLRPAQRVVRRVVGPSACWLVQSCAPGLVLGGRRVRRANIDQTPGNCPNGWSWPLDRSGRRLLAGPGTRASLNPSTTPVSGHFRDPGWPFSWRIGRVRSPAASPSANPPR